MDASEANMVEKGFTEVSESLSSIISNINAMSSRIDSVEKDLKNVEEKVKSVINKIDSEKKAKKKESSSMSNITEIDEKLGRLESLYQDYDFIITPITDAFHFIVSVETMLEGTKPRSDVEIAEYIKETYGKRGINYVNAAIPAANSTSRLTLVRALKRLKKILSSNKMINEGVDNIENSGLSEDDEEIASENVETQEIEDDDE